MIKGKLIPGCNLPDSRRRRTRILFLAWGFSIHAKRRIEIFIEDPTFAVTVVSTHDYEFDRARNVLLKGAQSNGRTVMDLPVKGECRGEERIDGFHRNSFAGILGKLRRGIDAAKLLALSVALLRKQLFSSLNPKWENIRKLKGFISSSEIRQDVIKASKDLRTIKAVFRVFKPDVVFLQTLLYPCFLAYHLPRSTPIIITFWNGDVTWWAQWSGIERRLKKEIVLYGVDRAQAITVNSASAFKACLQYGAREGKIRLIRYPGVDLGRFKPSAKSEARTRLKIASEKVVLLPRGLGDYLNSDIIVEAIPMVIRKRPNTLFLFLAGNGEEQGWEKHLQRAKQFGVEKNVRWDGKVPWEIMGQYYNASDLMVSISSNDSLPNCMLEAMACGTPIVMGDIPGLREWVTDGVNGFLVPLRDPVSLSEKIIGVLDGPEDMMASIVEKNLELARRFFDSQQNSQEIKKLVLEIAGYHGEKRSATHS